MYILIVYFSDFKEAWEYKSVKLCYKDLKMFRRLGFPCFMGRIWSAHAAIEPLIRIKSLYDNGISPSQVQEYIYALFAVIKWTELTLTWLRII